MLTSAELLETTEALLPEHRERLYPPTVTLSIFMRQVLEADGLCQKAVNGWAAQRAADGLSACSVRTGGYCRTCPRLPAEMVSALTRQTSRLLSEKALAQWLREVRVAHQVLVTTLLDHRRVSKDDLSLLYARRWNVELDLRNLKTTMGTDILAAKRRR